MGAVAMAAGRCDMPVCVPVSDLADTDAFTRLVQGSDEPVMVTENGHDAFVAMSTELLESLRMEAARAKLYELLAEAERDVREGRVYDARESQREVREQYGL